MAGMRGKFNLAVLLLALTCVTSTHANGSQPGAPAANDPESMLIAVYQALGANRLREAELRVDALVARYPNFRLGHLLRGDLLMMHTQPVKTFGAVPDASAGKLADLREEAIVRLRSLRERPDPNLLPRSVLFLREDQKNVLVVDARRSRLYVYENQRGSLKLVTDYYISQGKLGVNKLKEGDQRTPLGVYYITSRVPGARLPDFYGTGALPINYPNEWDKAHGRSGSGIWFHGVPSDSYSRPPLSSDGCVVLTNADMTALSAAVEINKTPVIISDEVEFVSRAKWEAERDFASKLLEGWRQDAESLNAERLMAHYSRKFKSARDQDATALLVRHQESMRGARNVSIQLREISFFVYPGQKDLMVGTFTQEATIGKARHIVRKRQYWAREGARWRIVSEANL